MAHSSGTEHGKITRAAMAERAAQKIFTLPGYQDIPDPSLPLGMIGLKKYFELCGQLYRQGKLNRATRDAAEQVAVMYQDQHARLTEGKRVPAYVTQVIQRNMSILNLIEETEKLSVADPERPNRFEHCGFPHMRARRRA